MSKQGEVFPDRKHLSLGMEVVLRQCPDAPGGDAQCCILYAMEVLEACIVRTRWGMHM